MKVVLATWNNPPSSVKHGDQQRRMTEVVALVNSQDLESQAIRDISVAADRLRTAWDEEGDEAASKHSWWASVRAWVAARFDGLEQRAAD